MEKLESYRLMDKYESISRIHEILVEQNGNNVYVIFGAHHGNLYTYVREKKYLSEFEAAPIFKQCVEAVRDCHENGIIVSDVKLNKFVFLDSEK